MGVKLVRDYTEENVRPIGVSGRWYRASEEEFLPALKRKLLEEVCEFLDNGDISELWDVQDVINELFHNLDPMYHSAASHRAKVAKFGTFQDHIMWDPVPKREDYV